MTIHRLTSHSPESDTSTSAVVGSSSDFPDIVSPSIQVNANGIHTHQVGRMDDVQYTEDFDTAMAQVLMRMTRLVENLRERGENDAANSIAKHTLSIVDVLNSTTAPWDTAALNLPLHGTANPLTRPPTTSSSGHTSVVTTAPDTGRTTWAAVAAVAPRPDNKLIKHGPSDSVQRTIEAAQPVAVGSNEGVDKDKRVVWIRSWPAHRPLSEVTDRIGQGPIFSMVYSEKDTAVCVIFQYAESAKALCADDQQYTKQNGQSRFGPGCDVVEGLDFPESSDMRRMLIPLNERRRLTFARQQLFANELTEEKFKRHVHAIVGERNVELVWLFNTGNATVVFSAVPLARLARSEFIKISKYPGSPYHGVGISFSHDPCERPMSLVTQMPAGRSVRPTGTYGREGVAPVGVVTKGGPTSRRSTIHDVDNSGWQTVGKRR